MPVFVAVDKREPQDAPRQSAFAKFFLCHDFTGRVCERRSNRIVLSPGMRTVRVINIRGACHDEASFWSVILNSGDKIAGAFEINSPYFSLIARAKHRGEMNDRRHALNGRRQRAGTEDVSFSRRHPDWKFFARPHQRAAINARFREAFQKSRANEARAAS